MRNSERKKVRQRKRENEKIQRDKYKHWAEAKRCDQCDLEATEHRLLRANVNARRRMNKWSRESYS